MASDGSVGKVHVADVVVIIVYFAVILFVGLWTSRLNRGSVQGYFLAGRNMPWLLVGASLFASNVGSLHFVGLAGSGAEAGIAVAIYELNAIFILMLLGWLFLPVYIVSGIFTMPEYIRKRFGGQRIRIYLAVLSLFMYIFTKISADLFAGAIFIEQTLQWNLYASVALLLGIAAIFTITGGLTAVIWTDFVQTFIMIIGAIGLMIVAFVRVGGFENMRFKYERAVPNTTFNNPNTTCGYPRKDYFHLFRDPHTGDIPWPGLFGILINSIWYWCADQVIVQRTLAAKNLSHSKGGCILAGYLKVLPMFIMIFPGMISRILFPDEIACTDRDVCMSVCSSPSGCSNIAYPLLVINLLPTGARGLLLAVMLSALMSSLTSIFNSSSTIFTIDIWRKIRKTATEVELLIVGRIAVLVLVVVSILWIPVIQNSQESQLFVYIQQVSSFLQPPLCAVYLLGILWARTNESGVFWSLVVGLVVGVTRMVLEFVYQPPRCGEPDTRPDIIKNFHYLYFGIFLFLLTCAVAIVISLLTPAIEEEKLYRLTFWTRWSEERRENIDEDSVMEVQDNNMVEETNQEVTMLPNESKENETVEYVSKSAVEAEQGDATESRESNLDETNGLNSLDTLNKKEVIDADEEQVQQVWWRRLVAWICGAEKQSTKISEEEYEKQMALAAKQNSIVETRFWKICCNVNALILMICAMFVIGFFA